MFPSFLATNFLSTLSSSWPAFNRSPSVNSALHTITILTKSPNHSFDLNSTGNFFLLLQQSNVSKPVKPNVLAAREKKQVSIQVSRPAIADFVTFDNQFRGNSICCQSTIYTSCVKLNSLQFIGKMRLPGKKSLNPLFWARTRCQVSKLLLLRFVFPIAGLIKMDLMLGLKIFSFCG